MEVKISEERKDLCLNTYIFFSVCFTLSEL